MWLLIVFLASIGLLHFIVGVSLLKNKINILVILVLVSLTPILYHPFAVQTNLNVIIKRLGTSEFVSGLVALEIAVILLTIFFSMDMIQDYYNHRKVQSKSTQDNTPQSERSLHKNNKTDFLATSIQSLKNFNLPKFFRMGYRPAIKKFLSLLPSVFFIVGIMLLHLWIFNTVSGTAYIWLSFSLALTVFLVLSIVVLLFKLLAKDWSLRLELKTLLSFLLITGAMLLPIFFQRISLVRLEESHFNLNTALLILGLAFFLSLLGFINYKYQITKNIWKHFIKY